MNIFSYNVNSTGTCDLWNFIIHGMKVYVKPLSTSVKGQRYDFIVRTGYQTQR